MERSTLRTVDTQIPFDPHRRDFERVEGIVVLTRAVIHEITAAAISGRESRQEWLGFAAWVFQSIHGPGPWTEVLMDSLSES